jgi:hypothetical protein
VQRGDPSGIRHPVPVSAFSTVDKNAFQNPRRHHIAARCKKLGNQQLNLMILKKKKNPIN